MKFFTLAVVLSAVTTSLYAAPGSIHLLQKPTMNRTEIVFSYSGDLWHVAKEGGVASRLTSGPGFERPGADLVLSCNPKSDGRLYRLRSVGGD